MSEKRRPGRPRTIKRLTESVRKEAHSHVLATPEQTELVRKVMMQMKNSSGLKYTEIAKSMGVPPSCVTRLKNNPGNMRLSSFLRYAQACGVDIGNIFVVADE